MYLLHQQSSVYYSVLYQYYSVLLVITTICFNTVQNVAFQNGDNMNQM